MQRDVNCVKKCGEVCESVMGECGRCREVCFGVWEEVRRDVGEVMRGVGKCVGMWGQVMGYVGEMCRSVVRGVGECME